jgi:hypothetical protein
MIIYLSLFVFTLAVAVLITTASSNWLVSAYRRSFRDRWRERLFISSLSFVLVFTGVRVVTHLIHVGRGGPFHFIYYRGTHIHHLVIGILLLLVVGYLWLVQIGTGIGQSNQQLSILTSILYGIGSALTLDEFALWLNLEDVYWVRQGRQSIDAVIIFVAVSFLGLWGQRFFREMGEEIKRLFRSQI